MPSISLKWVALGITFLVCLPILAILQQASVAGGDLWWHIWQTLLPEYISNSLSLMLGVALGVLLLGMPSAWLMARYQFIGQKWLDWALLLPLAMPAYIIAYTYTGLLDVAGPVQTWLRNITGLGYGDYWFWQIRSLSGAIVMLTLVLYPYLYLTLRASLLEQSALPSNVARTLGCSRWQAWYRVSLPLARPAIVAGLSIALMETLADYGTVQYFGVPTFTLGVFRSFYAYGDIASASQLAALLLSFVVILIFLERSSRSRMAFHMEQTVRSKFGKKQLTGWHAGLAFGFCLIPITCGFLIPVLQLLWWTLMEAEYDGAKFMQLAWNSVYLAFIAAILVVVLALVLGYAQRIPQHIKSQGLIKKAVALAGMGYALPGVLIAIGVLVPFTWLDHLILMVMKDLGLPSPGLLLSGSIVILLFAYSVRFLAVALSNVQSGLSSISPSLDQAGSSFGYSSWAILRKVHIPIMRASVFTALLVVFVDVLKELPATLMLRPFDFNTLAVRAFELASDEQLVQAAPASVMIVLVGLLPVILLNRAIARSC